MGGAETLDAGMETVLTAGPSRLSPFFMPMFLAQHGFRHGRHCHRGERTQLRTSVGVRQLGARDRRGGGDHRRGDADVMIAGGSEAPLARMVVAGFNAMGALSTRNDDPAAASRPFDAERDGFVLGEGGAALILESAETLRRAGATVLAELTGYATTDDANHMVQPAPGGKGAARAMTLALADAGLQPERHRLHQRARHIDADQ